VLRGGRNRFPEPQGPAFLVSRGTDARERACDAQRTGYGNERAHGRAQRARQQLSLVEFPRGWMRDDGFERLDVAAGTGGIGLEVATAALPKFTRAPSPNAKCQLVVVRRCRRTTASTGFASPHARQTQRRSANGATTPRAPTG